MMISLASTISGDSCRARCSPRSMPRSIATNSAPSDAGASGQALVPALDTSMSRIARCAITQRAMPSASGLRQVLPVQTNRRRMGSGIADEIGHGLT